MLKSIAMVIFLLATIAFGAPAFAEEIKPPSAQTTTATEAKGAEDHAHNLMDVDYASMVWTMIIFLILLAILYKTAWKNVLTGLKGREERIRNDISQAEEARAKAEAALKEYNVRLATAEAKASEILSRATTDAQALAERIKADADKAATERAQRAARDINDARDQALRDIYAQAADLSTSIAEKILRRSLNANDQRDLVAQSLEQLQNVNRG